MQDLNQTDCKQISEMLDAFRDVELSLEEAGIVESHLEDCPACRKELAEIELVVAKVKELPELPVRDFADAIEARILAASAAGQVGTAPAEVSPVAASVTGSSIQSSPPPAPSLAAAGNNVVPFAPPSRKRHRALMAVAAAAVLGLAATLALNPRAAVKVAQTPQISPAIVPASQKLDSEKGPAPLSEDVVALYDEDSSGSVSDAGISTNEDGLYAIKM